MTHLQKWRSKLQFVLGLFGVTVFFGLMYYAWNTQAYRWRILAKLYGVDGQRQAVARKYMQTIILFGAGPLFTSYKGTTIVTVTADGLELRQMPIFSWLHQPVYMPFTHLKASQSDWYLNSSTFEIIASEASEIRVAIDGELLDWIASHAPHWQVDLRRRW